MQWLVQLMACREACNRNMLATINYNANILEVLVGVEAAC